MQYTGFEFEWDATKNERNYQKHSVWFEEAQTIWADAHAIEFFDGQRASPEDRFLRVGHSTNSRLLLAVFCERNLGKTIRIISARKATGKERHDYEEGI